MHIVCNVKHITQLKIIDFLFFSLSRLGSRTTNEEIDEEEPEGEDLDDSEEEDDDRPKKKKKKERYGYVSINIRVYFHTIFYLTIAFFYSFVLLSNSGFIIDEAEVDDEVDEDEEWEDGANEIGIVNEVDEIGPTAREIEIRRRGNLWE